jgi:hypothetical protein
LKTEEGVRAALGRGWCRCCGTRGLEHLGELPTELIVR